MHLLLLSLVFINNWNCEFPCVVTAGCAAVVIGDSSGHLWAFSPYSDLWRLRLGDSKQTKVRVYLLHLFAPIFFGHFQTYRFFFEIWLQRPQNAPRVKSMLATKLLNQHGQSCHYLLAADDTQHLYFIHQGSIVLTLKTPAVVNAVSIFWDWIIMHLISKEIQRCSCSWGELYSPPVL